jgi:Raf kinase inhibitor-like YbhB/YbcL family protein
MRFMRVVMVVAIMIAVAVAMAVAQAPAAGQGGGQRGPGAGAPPAGGQGAPGGAGGGRQGAGRGQRGPAFNVTSNAWPDGGEVPMKHAGRGDNKSPAFEFHWFNGTEPAEQPATVQSFAVIFHDIENATNRGTADTLHWTAYNIPATAKGLPEGLPGGDLPDGTKNGPGINAGRGMPSYFGPGAGPGPFHHYVFEFYALDTKLDFPALPTRDQLMQAMEGHVVGKSAFVGRFHGQ